jgi:U5 small nuclear ribonucleoprotein component
MFIDNASMTLLDHKDEAEAIYNKMKKIIDDANEIISANNAGREYSEPKLLDPIMGNVLFGSLKYKWAITLPLFAKRLAHRNPSLSEESTLKYLWGNWYMDRQTKKITQNATDSERHNNDRAFCAMFLKPVLGLQSTIMSTSDAHTSDSKLWSMLDKISVEVTQEERLQLKSDELLKTVMSKWLSMPKALVTAIIDHIQTPRQSQQVC